MGIRELSRFGLLQTAIPYEILGRSAGGMYVGETEGNPCSHVCMHIVVVTCADIFARLPDKCVSAMAAASLSHLFTILMISSLPL